MAAESKGARTPPSYEREQGILGALLQWGRPALDIARASGWAPELARRPQIAALGAWLVEEVEAGRVVDVASAIDCLHLAPPTHRDSPTHGEAVELLCVAPQHAPPALGALPAYVGIVVTAHRDARLAELQAALGTALRTGDHAEAGRIGQRIAALVTAPKPQRTAATAAPAAPADELDARPDPATVAAIRAVPKRARADERILARVVLSTDPRWRDRVWYDSMRGRQMLGADAWADHLDGDAALWLSTTYGIRIGTGPVRELLAALAQQHRRHPLQEYLDGLRWDGVPRLDTWLTYALGVEDSPLVRTLARRWLIQAVARATRPGCQADATLVLVGAQGKYKSSVVGALAGREFFSENPINIHGDTSDLVSLVHSAWIHDMSEGADVRRAEVDRLKQFLTTRVDIYRRKYGRNHEERPRFSVFVSTTNDDRFLPADPTGARRFWPVTCARGDVSWVESHRDQLWAEALVALASGERWHLVDEECSALIDHQSAYEQDDALTGRVGRWLREQATRLWVGGERGGREPITTEEVMGGPLGLTPEQMGRRSNEMRAGDILRRLHYTRRRVRSGEALIWAYVPSASVENPV